MNKKTIVTAIILYLVSTGISYGAFNYLESSPTGVSSPLPAEEDGILAIDPNEPRDQECILSGEEYTTTEREVWEKRRPLAVMIENHKESRPQSGLSRADIVYETIAEGGITRFLAIYYCDAVANDVFLAPVRSARTYFLDWASEYGETPLYVHVGGANLPGPADALGQIQKYGWGGRNGNDINQFSVGYPTFWRDYNRLDRTVATEHTMMSTTERLWKVGVDRGWTNLNDEGEEWTDNFTSWDFKDEEGEEERGEFGSIVYDFWEDFEDYTVKWDYDRTQNVYKRLTGGQNHIDHNSGEQLVAKNVVIQFTVEKGPIDELKHMLYTTVGKGDALIFQDGKVIEGTWSKASRVGRTVFKDEKGKDISFVRGPIWIAVIANGTEISY